MSDNLTTPVASGSILATDDVAGVQYPRVKISFGVDGSAADVNSGNRFPVDVGTSIAVTQSGSWSLSATQSGAWNITNITGTISLPTGAATSALQTTANTSLAAIAASVAAAEPGSTGGNVTPSDSTTLSGVRMIWVGGAGTVVATVGGVDITFAGVPAGTWLPIKATKIKAATTATSIAWIG